MRSATNWSYWKLVEGDILYFSFYWRWLFGLALGGSLGAEYKYLVLSIFSALKSRLKNYLRKNIKVLN